MSAYSIKSQLTLAVITGSTVIILAGTIFLDAIISLKMQEMFDASLFDKAKSLMALTEQEIDGVEFEFPEGMMPEFGEIDIDNPEKVAGLQYFQLWINTDDVLERSISLGDNTLTRNHTELNHHSFYNDVLPDGRLGRYIEIVFYPPLEEPDEGDIQLGKIAPDDINLWKKNVDRKIITLVLAREQDSLQDLIMNNRLIIASVMMLALLVIAGLVVKLIKKGLHPLEQLAEQVQKIDEKSINNQIQHSGDISIELAPIEQQINRLLRRLEKAFLREQRFSSDVAHELRTPISELKTLTEVGVMNLNDTEMTKQFYTDVNEISTQMENLVTSLLGLAKADADLLTPTNDDFSLSQLIKKHTLSYSNKLPIDKRFKISVPSDIVVHSDREKLSVIIRNLLENAANYSPQEANIKIYGVRNTQHYSLTIENTTTNLHSEDIQYLCERFWRKEQSRSDSLHAGLGLTLVAALSEILDITLEFELDKKGLFYAKLYGLKLADR